MTDPAKIWSYGEETFLIANLDSENPLNYTALAKIMTEIFNRKFTKNMIAGKNWRLNGNSSHDR